MPELKVKIGGDGSGFAAAAAKSVKDAQKAASQISLAQATSAAFNNREFQRQMDMENAARNNRARALRRERAEQRAARAEAAKPPVIAPPVMAGGDKKPGFFGSLKSGLLGGFSPASLGAGLAGALSVATISRYVAALDALVERILKTSDALGVSTGFFQGFEFAAEQSNVKTEEATAALTKFAENLGKAQEGDEEAIKKFEQLGLSIYTAGGGLKTVEQMTMEFSDALKGAETDAQRVAMAVSLMGKGGAKAVPLLKDGAEALKNLMGKASLLSKEDADLLDAASDKWKEFKAGFMSESGGLIAAFARVGEAALQMGEFVASGFQSKPGFDFKDAANDIVRLIGAASGLRNLPEALGMAPRSAASGGNIVGGTNDPGSGVRLMPDETPASQTALAKLDEARQKFSQVGETDEEKLNRLTGALALLQHQLEAMQPGSAGATAIETKAFGVAAEVKQTEIDIAAKNKTEEDRPKLQGLMIQADSAAKMGGFIGGSGPGVVSDIIGHQQLNAQMQIARNTAATAAAINSLKSGEWGER